MKLAIADTSDQILDSVVMIKSGTLSTTKPESCNDAVDNDDDTFVDMEDSYCQATTTPAPPGSTGIGWDGSTPPFTGNEGTPIPLVASALGWAPTPDTVSTSWSVHGINGTPGTCEVVPAGPVALEADGSIAVVHAICPNEGEYTARVDGWDVEGKSAFDTDVDFFVHNAPPSVTIDSPLAGATAAVGAAVDLSATVVDPGASDVVTCSIDWGDGTTEPGTLTAGTCTGSHVYPTAESYLISVTATDDAGDSTAAATVVAVGVEATTVTSDVNPSVRGQAITLTATTTVAATGTMGFYDGTTLLGSRSVVGGTASLTTKALHAGAHSITAAFKPTPTSPKSVSSPLLQQVDQAATTTALTSSVNPSVNGQRVTVRATVKTVAPGSGAPIGSVAFYDGGTLVATKALSSGTAAIVVRPKAGTHAYTAVYAGSSDHLGSATAAPLQQVVGKAATTATLSSTFPTTTFGHGGNVIAKVAAVAPGGGVPTGTVDFYEGSTHLGSYALVDGWARMPLATLPVGVHVITATYGGDSGFLAGSSSTAFTQTIT